MHCCPSFEIEFMKQGIGMPRDKEKWEVKNEEC